MLKFKEMFFNSEITFVYIHVFYEYFCIDWKDQWITSREKAYKISYRYV